MSVDGVVGISTDEVVAATGGGLVALVVCGTVSL
jgi:hypothetical protein